MSDSERIHAEILREPGVDSAVVRQRALPGGGSRLVAYVVLTGATPADVLHTRLETRLDAADFDAAVVLVSHLPLDARGELDEAALQALPVLDRELLGELETRAAAACDAPLAVIAAARECVLPELSLAELLPPEFDERVTRPKSAGLCPTDSPARKGPPSLATGPELQRSVDDPQTLPDALRRAAQLSPDRGLVYVQPDGCEIRQSYPALLAEAEVILAGLQAAGLARGAMALLQLERNQDFVPAFWACLLGGIVPVPVSIAARYDAQNATVQKLRNAWEMLDRPVVLVGPALSADVARAADAVGMAGARLLDIEALRGLRGPAELPVPDPDDLALLLLTSGSTGLPKAVMHSHRTLIDRSLSTLQANGYTARDTSVNWMPLDHVGGIIMYHLRDLVACAQQVHAPTEYVLQDPLRWLDLVERHRATDTWAPNFAFGLVNERVAEAPGRSWDLSALRFILNGGEAIVAKTARRFMQSLAPFGLPPSAMHPAWGMSETSSGVTYNDAFRLETTSDEDAYVVVGKPIPGVQVRVVDDHNQPVPEGSTGRLQVRGVSVTLGYYKNPELNSRVFTPDGWFTTGDLGLLRDGQLAITGREKDEVIINGVNYVGAEIEAVVDGVSGVAASFSAACAVRPQGADTDQLAVFFSPEREDLDLAALLRAVTTEVGTRIGISPRFLVPLPPAQIPKTAIGKIQRRQLRERFESGEFEGIVAHTQVLLGHGRTLPAWFYRRVLRPEVRRTSSGKMHGRVVAFVPDDTRGRALARQVPNLVRVEPGEAFELVGPEHFRIRAAVDEDYDRLWSALKEGGDQPAAVMHAWAWGDAVPVSSLEEIEEAQARGAASVLRLVRAIGQQPPHRLRIVIVTSHVQAVGDRPPNAAHATLMGMARSLSPELAWADTVHVDVQTGDPGMDAAAIAAELCAGDGAREVVHSATARLVPRFASVSFAQSALPKSPLVRGGFYIMSGGLGGVGALVGRLLCERYGARLLILGRSPLGARAGALGQLAAGGGAARYAVADVSREVEVRGAMQGAAADWGRPDGVLHLAGKLDQRLLPDTTPAQLQSQLTAKVAGTAVLHRVLAAGGGGTFISFSSLAGSFGWATMGGYGAANAFVGAFAEAMNGRDGVRHYCYEWSTWDGLGMSSQSATSEIAAARGFAAMQREQAVNSLLIALRWDLRSGLIGLDGRNPHIRRLVEQPVESLLEPVCCYEAGGTGGEPPALNARDRFGQSLRCAVRVLPKLPRKSGGELERVALIGNAGSTERAEVPSELERQLAAICREVLGCGRVEVDDDLFALGADSLTGMRLLNRIRERVRVELSLKDLFEASTVSRLAARVSQIAGRAGSRPAPTAVSPVDARRLLARIDEMSEDEVNRTLAALVRAQG